ncbi:MAG: viroplasmin family protein [Alkaliphilus sp.]
MAKKKYYAVRKGRKTGILQTWAECQESIKGYSSAEYKSFESMKDAEAYLVVSTKNSNAKTIDQLEKNEMIAYVDGSYSAKKQLYSYGVVIFHDDEKHNFSEAECNSNLLSMRNVAGEIKGAEIAMKYAIDNKVEKLYLHYDYDGIEKWATNAWEAKKEGTQEYKRIYNRISKKLEVIFVKVKAHSGDEFNDEADELAKRAIALYETTKTDKPDLQDSLHTSTIGESEEPAIYRIKNTPQPFTAIRKKNLIILYVKDQKQSRDFYRSILGKEPILDVDGMTEFELGRDFLLGLMPEEGIRKIIGDALPHPKEGSGIPRAELYLYVGNPLETYNLIDKNGGKLIKEPTMMSWGDIVAYGADLDGHILAFAKA